MRDLPFPLSGSTLVAGPSNAGKTRLTAESLDTWVDEHGPLGVVVFDFAPELVRDGRVLGGRLTRFTTVPDRAWYGVLEAYAPRAEGADESAAVRLARDNAVRGARLVEGAPGRPRTVFANDVTIPFQHPRGDLEGFLRYCDRAETVVMNAFRGDELGTDDPVTARERAAFDRIHGWVDRTIELGSES